MKLTLKQHGGTDVLAGSIAGQKMLASLMAQTGRPDTSEVVYLDFAGISVATASFLRESVIGFRDYCRTCDPVLYCVVANASDTVLEELRMFLRERGDAFWCCELAQDEVVSHARILGKSKLEDGQRIALDLVCERKSTTAPELSQLGEKLGPTGWNNRLAALSARLLVRERRDGKLKIFSPVLEVA